MTDTHPTAPADVAAKFRYRQYRTLIATMFGYASTLVSRVGLGYVVDHFGWSVGFGALLAIGAIGTVMFILAWPAKAHGYASASS